MLYVYQNFTTLYVCDLGLAYSIALSIILLAKTQQYSGVYYRMIHYVCDKQENYIIFGIFMNFIIGP